MVLGIINTIRSHYGVEKREQIRKELIEDLLGSKVAVSSK